MRFGFQPKRKARGKTSRRVAGEMNKTEARYMNEVLVPMMDNGEIIGFAFEQHTFKLGADLRYTPDFAVQKADGMMEFHEVKAAMRNGKPIVEDDARVKIIVAAEMLPYTFRMVWPTAHGWKEKVYA